MEKIKDSWSKFTKSISDIWAKQSSAGKIALISGIFIAFAGIFGIFFLADNKSYEYLFVDLSDEDTNAIADYLRKNNVKDFIIDQRGIKVKSTDTVQMRVKLSQEGLPHQGVIGWEKFDDENFTRTEFEQEIQKQRAIQGELSRTISAIEGVTSTRVHIVMPKTSVFMREKQKPTASIYLKTRRGVELEQKQIKGIQHLVSRAVEGLEINNIAIIGSDGKMLSDIEPTDMTSKQSRESERFKSSLEKNLEERVRTIVGRIVGPDRVEAKVDAEVDFTSETQTISDIDPDDIAVVSKNTSGFSMEGQGLNPTGIPGSKSNVPGEQEDLAVNQSKSGSKKDTELVNYEFSKKVSQKTIAVGKILRLTVSAIVDGKQIYPLDGSVPEFEARTQEEMKKIEELIKNAVGFKEGRDALTVHNMMFQLDPFQMMEITKKKKEDREYLSTLAISAVIALAIMLFFALIVRPYFRWLSYDPERKEEQSMVEEYKPDLELGSMQSVQIQEDVPFDKLSPKEQVMFLARNEPQRTTEAIRIMLSPTHHG